MDQMVFDPTRCIRRGPMVIPCLDLNPAGLQPT